MTDADAAIVILGQFALFMALGLAIYAVPSFIAFRRRHPNRYAILAVNLAFGGTGIGWLGSLVWALRAVHLSNHPEGSDGGESGLNVFVNDPKPVWLTGSAEAIPDDAASAGDPSSTGAALAELERLSRLRAAGHLSEAEFDDLKREILERLRRKG